MRTRLSLSIVRYSFFALLLSGCITTTTPYPVEWAVVSNAEAPGGCAPIRGTYLSRGEKQQRAGGIGNEQIEHADTDFAEVFKQSGPLNYATHVDLVLAEEDARMTFWIGDELLFTRSFVADELRCQQGAWQFDLDSEFIPSAPSMLMDWSVGSATLRFSQATDQTLIVENTEKVVGAVFLVVGGKFVDQMWHRFAPASVIDKQPRPDGPAGVMEPGSQLVRLLPPESYEKARENTATISRCYEAALKTDGGDVVISDRQLARLEGRPTQAFLFQIDPDGPVYTSTDYIDRKRGHVPAIYMRANLRKPHWLVPGIADRYVHCLLDAGYTWDVAKPESR